MDLGLNINFSKMSHGKFHIVYPIYSPMTYRFSGSLYVFDTMLFICYSDL